MQKGKNWKQIGRRNKRLREFDVECARKARERKLKDRDLDDDDQIILM